MRTKIIILMLILLISTIPVNALNISEMEYMNVTEFNYSLVNKTEAFASSNNLSANFNVTFDSEQYPLIHKMMEFNQSKTPFDNIAAMIGAPINDYWVVKLGAWFYVLFLVLTVFMVYGKTDSIEATSMVMIFGSVLLSSLSMADIADVPDIVLNLMYLFTAIGIGMIFKEWFVGD
jgi:hypothetical protein